MWYWSVLYCTHQYRNGISSIGDTHTSAYFKIVNKCKISKFARFKLKDFSRIFKYFQTPYLFSSTLRGLEVFSPNSNIFKDLSSTLWILQLRLRRFEDHCRLLDFTVSDLTSWRVDLSASWPVGDLAYYPKHQLNLMTVRLKFRRYKMMYLLSVSPWLFLLALTQLDDVVAEYLLAVTHLLNAFEPLVLAVLRCEVVEWRPGKW